MHSDLFVVKPEGILDLFQSAAALNASLLKVGMDDLGKNGLTYVVLRIKYQVFRQIPKDSEVIVTTWPNPKGKIRFLRQFEIKDLDGNLMVLGSSLWVLMDLKTRRIMKTDNFDYQTDTLYEEKNFDIEDKIDLSDIEFKYVKDYQVSRDDIDRVGHLNNTKYLKMLYEVQSVAIKELTIDYIKEVKYNDIVKLYLGSKDNYEYLIGKKDETICFAIKYMKESD